MSDEIKKYTHTPESSESVRTDLQGTANYKIIWTSEKTCCSWPDSSLHWNHCNETVMHTLPNNWGIIKTILISVGNLLADHVIHADYSHQRTIEGINKVLQSQKRGGDEEEKYLNLEKITKIIENTIRETIFEIKNDRHPSYVEEKLRQILTHLKSKQNDETYELIKSLEIKLDTLGSGLINDEKECRALLKEVKKKLTSISNRTTNEQIKNDLESLLRIGNSEEEEISQLGVKIERLQLEITDLRQKDLHNLKDLSMQNQQVIDLIKSININDLKGTIEEVNKKIPDIGPLLSEQSRMFRKLESISKAIGYEDQPI